MISIYEEEEKSRASQLSRGRPVLVCKGKAAPIKGALPLAADNGSLRFQINWKTENQGWAGFIEPPKVMETKKKPHRLMKLLHFNTGSPQFQIN